MPVSRNSTGMSGLICAAMCNSTADSEPNDETSATLSPKCSIAARRMACGSASRSSAFSLAIRLAVSSPSNAMIGLPFDVHGFERVSGALIDVPEIARGLRPGLRGRTVHRLEGVEAAALHEACLFAPDVADRPHLALEPVALTQQRRGREGPAVAKGREDQRHHRDARQVIGERIHSLAGLDPDADVAAIGEQRLAFSLEPGHGDDYVALRRRLIVGDAGETVVRGDEPAVDQLNELRHRSPP